MSEQKDLERARVVDAMCMTWRHDFGLDRKEDGLGSCGMTDTERAALRRQMGQLYDHHFAAPSLPAAGSAVEERMRNAVIYGTSHPEIYKLGCETAQAQAQAQAQGEGEVQMLREPTMDMVQAACAAFRMDVSPMLAMREAIRAALSAQQSAQPEFCCEHSYKVAKQAAWGARDLTQCKCDHNEYCEHCWPDDFREGGKWHGGFTEQQSAPELVSVPVELAARLQRFCQRPHSSRDEADALDMELRALLASHAEGGKV